MIKYRDRFLVRHSSSFGDEVGQSKKWFKASFGKPGFEFVGKSASRSVEMTNCL